MGKLIKAIGITTWVMIHGLHSGWFGVDDSSSNAYVVLFIIGFVFFYVGTIFEIDWN